MEIKPVHYGLVGSNKQGFPPVAESPMAQHMHAIALNLLVSLSLQNINIKHIYSISLYTINPATSKKNHFLCKFLAFDKKIIIKSYQNGPAFPSTISSLQVNCVPHLLNSASLQWWTYYKYTLYLKILTK